MSKSYDNAQTNATTLFMSLLPLLVCIKNFIYPFIMLNHLFLSPFVNNLPKNGIKLWREEKKFDGVG
jgi:hypothetical protein